MTAPTPIGETRARWFATPGRILGGLFLFALLLRILSAGLHDTISHDAAVFYLPGARALVAHGLGYWDGLSAANPPLFATLVALVGFLIHDLEWAALMLSTVGGSLIVFPVWGMARFFFPQQPRVAPLAATIAAAQPFLVRYGGDAVADSLYALFFALALWMALLLVRTARPWCGLLFGGCLGMAYLLRPEALGLAPLAGVAVLLVALGRRGDGAQGYLRRLVLGGGLALVALTPALAWNMAFVHHKLGVWTLSPKAGVLVNFEKGHGRQILTSLNPERTMTLYEQATTDPSAYQNFSLTEMHEVAWGARFAAWARNLKEFCIYFVEGLGPTCVVLFLIGLYRARRREEAPCLDHFAWGGLGVLLSVLAFYAVVLSVFYMSRRFLLPLYPLVLPWCGLGLAVWSDVVRRRWAVSQGLIVSVVMGLILLKSVHHFGGTEARWWTRPEMDVGHRLRSRHGPEQMIVSAKGKVAWYAEGHHLFLPAASLPDIAAYMENRGARLLVFERRTRHRDHALEKALESDPRFEEVDSQVWGKRTYRVFERRDSDRVREPRAG